MRSDTKYMLSRRTGRFVSTTAVVGPRTVPIQSESSSALLTVADRHTSWTCWREVDDHLLPDRSAIGVLEEVHLVEHDDGQIVEIAPAVDHVAQHFGRHHHDGGIAVDRVVTGQETDTVVTVDLDEIAVLLIRECLDGRGVERASTASERHLDAVLGDDGLATAGRSGDDDMVALVERVQRVELELVEFERVAGEKVVPVGAHDVSVAGRAPVRPASLRCRRRCTIRPIRIATKYSTTIGTDRARSEIGSPDGVIAAATRNVPTIA